MTYQIIGTPHIETEYCDEYETVMTVDVRREDGVTGDVWIVAGVPAYSRDSSDVAHTQRGYETVRVFGNSPDNWCAESLVPEDGEYGPVVWGILAAVTDAAIEAHRSREEK